MYQYQLLKETFKDKRVFLTGHTGFKGAWMLQILHWLGADVKGYALPPESPHNLYPAINGDELCYASINGDVRDLPLLRGEMSRFEPHFVFHLAAQSLVRRSYVQPVETFMVNTIGTVHVLEAIRGLRHPLTGVIVTTDKVYENPERGIPFKEDDKLGGYDPYSASKATAELATDSYRRSFFHPEQYSSHQKAIAAARAGNVIGGGDYAEDRIIPDIVRAIEFEGKVALRNPDAIRPWQHVLEPLGAYLLLAARMNQDPLRYAGAYNFGPDTADCKTVEELTQIFLKAYNMEHAYTIERNEVNPHEAGLLLLDSSRAATKLGWRPKLDATTAIRLTASWYADKSTTSREKCGVQIKQYFEGS